MKITALEEYGLRCMLFLAKRGREVAVTLPEISTEEGLSIPYAGKLLMILKQSGLVKAVRGRKGGYVLSKPPEQIFLKEIFDCLGEPVFAKGYCNRHTGDFTSCVHKSNCDVKKIWVGLDSFINSIFNKVTLAELAFGNYSFLETLVKSAEKNDNVPSDKNTLPVSGG
jgi:Rrf2 family transcriptional regulator, iron-sulfur cluster assembly transcription factor